MITLSETDLSLSRKKVFWLLFFLWLLMYLPSLGVPEFRGEEGRRVLPAVTMLQNGNWIQPYIGGEPYYSKPPGINWLVAASFILTQHQNEFTARLVSVVSILAFVSLIIFRKSPWLNLKGKLIAAIVFMTNISLLEKGRQIEIEPVYICLTGAASFWWLNELEKNTSKWSLWVIPLLIVTYGMLVKGPVILILFYLMALIALTYTRQLKKFFCFEHLVGLLILILIFGGWFYLAKTQTSGSDMTEQMSGQMGSRLTYFPKFSYWAMNVVKSFVNFLPWLLFVPALWDRRLIGSLKPSHVRLFKGARLALIVSFILINLMPGMMPRYSLPTFALASILLGWALSMHPLSLFGSDKIWKTIVLVAFPLVVIAAAAGLIQVKRDLGSILAAVMALLAAVYFLKHHNHLNTVLKLSVATAVLAAVLMLQYATFGMEFVKSDDIHRPEATTINSIVPEEEILYVYKPGFQAFIFYLDVPIVYLLQPHEINDSVHYLLIDEKLLKAKTFQPVFNKKNITIRHQFPGRLHDFGESFVLVEINH